MGTSHEDRHTFIITSRSVLLIMTNISDKLFKENQNILLCPITLFENRAVYEVM